MDKEGIIREIVDSAVTVKKELGAGFLEAVYQNALAVELSLRGIKAETETPVSVYYKHRKVGVYRADLLVENEVIVELKVVNALDKAHEFQLVNYLYATGKHDGLLINFGSAPIEIKRKFGKSI